MTRSIILAGRRRRKRKEKKETKKRKEAKENKAKNKREKQKKNVKVKKINIYKYIATWPFLAGCIIFLLRDILPEEKQIRPDGLQLMQIFFRLAFRLLIRLQKRRSGRPFFLLQPGRKNAAGTLYTTDRITDHSKQGTPSFLLV